MDEFRIKRSTILTTLVLGSGLHKPRQRRGTKSFRRLCISQGLQNAQSDRCKFDINTSSFPTSNHDHKISLAFTLENDSIVPSTLAFLRYRRRRCAAFVDHSNSCGTSLKPRLLTEESQEAVAQSYSASNVPCYLFFHCLKVERFEGGTFPGL